MELIITVVILGLLLAAGSFFYPALKSRFEAKQEENKIDISNINLTIADLKVGDFIDFEGETFEVTKAYGGEWQLKNASKVTFYLEREEDDETTLTLSEKIEPRDFLSNKDLQEFDNGEHLSKVTHEEVTYLFEEEDDGELNGKPFYYWEYEGPENTFITLEQWEDGFEAVIGKVVKEYHFDNILRRS